MPMRHFGVILPMEFGVLLPMEEWQRFADRLKNAGVKFIPQQIDVNTQ